MKKHLTTKGKILIFVAIVSFIVSVIFTVLGSAGLMSICFAIALFAVFFLSGTGWQKDIPSVDRDVNSAVSTFSKEDLLTLQIFRARGQKAETAQVIDLMVRCTNKYQFAKTHSAFIKDWERTKEKMLQQATATGTNKEVVKEMGRIGDELLAAKLQTMRTFFENKWGESIYNYLRSDGKTRKLFGIFG